jgi:hypothetical protein
MRAVLWVLAPLFLLMGCASEGAKGRSSARHLLLGLAAASAAGVVGAAVISDQKEKSLQQDVQAGTLTGRQFADRDAEGRRWNRIGRASAFVGVLSLVGLGILWQMDIADRVQEAATEPTPGGDAVPLLPPPGASAEVGASSQDFRLRAPGF